MLFTHVLNYNLNILCHFCCLSPAKYSLRNGLSSELINFVSYVSFRLMNQNKKLKLLLLNGSCFKFKVEYLIFFARFSAATCQISDFKTNVAHNLLSCACFTCLGKFSAVFSSCVVFERVSDVFFTSV